MFNELEAMLCALFLLNNFRLISRSCSELIHLQFFFFKLLSIGCICIDKIYALIMCMVLICKNKKYNNIVIVTSVFLYLHSRHNSTHACNVIGQTFCQLIRWNCMSLFWTFFIAVVDLLLTESLIELIGENIKFSKIYFN